MRHLCDLTLILQIRGLTDLPGAPEALQQLTQLTSLQLQHDYTGVMPADSSCWGKLPALLEISTEATEPSYWSPEEFQDVSANLSRATALTKLDLTAKSSEEDGPVAFCKQLKGMTQLQELGLWWWEGEVAARDCLHLTALTGLTSLSFEDLGDAVGDTVAVALAANLSQLCSLKLSGCGLQTDTVLPVLAQRQQLSTVILHQNSGFTERVLEGIASFNRCGEPSLAALF